MNQEKLNLNWFEQVYKNTSK